MERRTRLRIFAALCAVIAVAAVSFGAPRVRDAVDGVDDEVALDTPGEYQQPADDAPVSGGDVGDPLPSVEVLATDGTGVLTGDLIGQPMVVNLWFSACPPCAREMPEFAAVASDVGEQVRFVGVNPIDDVERMLSFAASTGVEYELLRDPLGRFTDALGTVSFPLTVFVAADGTVVDRTGVLTEDQLRGRISELFEIEMGV